MADLNDYPQDLYRSMWAKQSPAFRRTLREKTANVLDTYLMSFGEAKNYNEHRHLVNTLLDAVILFLVTDTWLVLTDKATATDDEQAAALKAKHAFGGEASGTDLLNLHDPEA